MQRQVSYIVIDKWNIGRTFDIYKDIIDISYDPMQISCPQYSHVDWDSASLSLSIKWGQGCPLPHSQQYKNIFFTLFPTYPLSFKYPEILRTFRDKGSSWSQNSKLSNSVILSSPQYTVWQRLHIYIFSHVCINTWYNFLLLSKSKLKP